MGSVPDELTIGEIADRLGMTTSALRFYERRGLIRSRRTSGNQRRYGPEAMRTVAFIQASTHVGIPLSAIRGVLDLLPAGAAPDREVWLRAAHCWEAHLDDRIQGLERLRGVFGTRADDALAALVD